VWNWSTQFCPEIAVKIRSKSGLSFSQIALIEHRRRNLAESWSEKEKHKLVSRNFVNLDSKLTSKLDRRRGNINYWSIFDRISASKSDRISVEKNLKVTNDHKLTSKLSWWRRNINRTFVDPISPSKFDRITPLTESTSNFGRKKIWNGVTK